MPTVGPSAATWAIVLLLSLMSGLTTLLGVVLAIRLEKNARAIALGIGFSAGIMLLISGVELVPASLRDAGAAWTFGGVALGAGLIAALHVVIPHVHLFEERGLLDASMLRASTLVALGLILHDFPEGTATRTLADGREVRQPCPVRCRSRAERARLRPPPIDRAGLTWSAATTRTASRRRAG